MSSDSVPVHIELEEATHSIALDYFSKKVLLGTSSGKVMLQTLNAESRPEKTIEIYAHRSPVSSLDWAHPSFGELFASCDFDGIVKIWERSPSDDEFRCIDEKSLGSSATSLRFCPSEYGCSFAVSSSNGRITIFTKSPDGHFSNDTSFAAHEGGCNSLSWAPSTPPTSLVHPGIRNPSPMRICTGGSDSHVCIWRFNGRLWECECKLDGHRGAVTHVEFCPSIGMPGMKLVSCSADKSVIIWTSFQQTLQHWEKQPIVFDEIPHKATWSETGDIIAISRGLNKVILIKEGIDGAWSLLKELEQEEA
ncbi:Sec13B [Monocercomonoides exilis]|uniref:Sec13B n=1 Tax=Monocercomonoides exilis TaxID=2049356 RepID=UPI0035598841|nr:Sec13B [Monocercomonoides exilis]|eukprot:MONOS_1833.1-p1 / transcript=MONOS_1833.1 / gene=MONOS_1833 / organism=Monocercomonoides_exilis_PA203 / gene_product= Sec13B / transcript_product= Sec13B / location=Mono_scaffold00034:166488-167729(-) / protein_length=307 / sequence_SO=supercontig / SO=protein_coding / is_pseudo=false